MLQEKLKVRVTTSVLRIIRDRYAGSFDKYLIKTREELLRMPLAIDMKRRILEIYRQRSLAGIDKSKQLPPQPVPTQEDFDAIGSIPKRSSQ